MKDQYVPRSWGGEKFGRFKEQLGKWSWSAVSWVRGKSIRGGQRFPWEAGSSPNQALNTTKRSLGFVLSEMRSRGMVWAVEQLDLINASKGRLGLAQKVDSRRVRIEAENVSKALCHCARDWRHSGTASQLSQISLMPACHIYLKTRSQGHGYLMLLSLTLPHLPLLWVTKLYQFFLPRPWPLHSFILPTVPTLRPGFQAAPGHAFFPSPF